METEYYIPLVILNIFTIIISLYLFFLFIKSKSFHTYPCYNIIIFSLIILLDNILRILPLSDDDNTTETVMEYIQAYLLVLFDKLILATLATQAFIFYLGVVKTKFYYDHEKAIFIIPFIINLLICNAITAIYIVVNDIHRSEKKLYYYCGGSDSNLKKIIDTIFDTFYFVLNLFCTIFLILFIFNEKNQADSGKIEDFDYKHNLIRITLLFLLNLATFLESYLIIYRKLTGIAADFVYLSTCLLIDIYNSSNKIVLIETMKIFCKKKYEQYEKINKAKKSKITDDNENDDKNIELQRTRTESF